MVCLRKRAAVEEFRQIVDCLACSYRKKPREAGKRDRMTKRAGGAA